MGRGSVAGNGEGPTATARRAVRDSSGRLRNGLPAGGHGVLFLLPDLGLATFVFPRRLAGAARLLCPIPGEGIGGVAGIEARELERARPRDRIALEGVPLHRIVNDYDEFRLARYAGSVSDGARERTSPC